MKRVQQTLAPVLRQPRPTPIILPKLHEVHFGDWQGLNFPEVKARFGYDAHQWLELLAAGTIPNGENLDGYRESREQLPANHPATERRAKPSASSVTAV
jgi:broad specificity phosphatase PhoE